MVKYAEMTPLSIVGKGRYFSITKFFKMYGTSHCTILPYMLFVNVLPVSSFSPFSSTSQTQRGQKANVLLGHMPWKYLTMNRLVNFPVFNCYLQLLRTIIFWEKLGMCPMGKPLHKTLQVEGQATLCWCFPSWGGQASLLWNWVSNSHSYHQVGRPRSRQNRKEK